jgi:SAM-dependent methyltransferase
VTALATGERLDEQHAASGSACDGSRCAVGRDRYPRRHAATIVDGLSANIYSRLIERLDRITTGSRYRYANSVFWNGSGRHRDRLASALYFELSARLWASRGQDAQHLAPFVAGLDRCSVPERILDLGTGAGGTAALLAERFSGAEVIGLDGSRAMVRVAASKYTAPNLRFVKGDLRRLPFGDGEFDLVTAHNALPEPRELGRVCCLDGFALLANTYFWGWPTARLERLGASGLHPVSDGRVDNGGWLLLVRRATT